MTKAERIAELDLTLRMAAAVRRAYPSVQVRAAHVTQAEARLAQLTRA